MKEFARTEKDIGSSTGELQFARTEKQFARTEKDIASNLDELPFDTREDLIGQKAKTPLEN
ncbi:hypothetical protein GCM10025777_22830 [Membranihabitans marinus]